jgi:hypothetical protein
VGKALGVRPKLIESVKAQWIPRIQTA